jgi:hypothetical protein
MDKLSKQYIYFTNTHMYINLCYVVGEITYEYLMSFLTERLHFVTSCCEMCQLYSLRFSENELVQLLIVEHLHFISPYTVMTFCLWSRFQL